MSLNKSEIYILLKMDKNKGQLNTQFLTNKRLVNAVSILKGKGIIKAQGAKNVVELCSEQYAVRWQKYFPKIKDDEPYYTQWHYTLNGEKTLCGVETCFGDIFPQTTEISIVHAGKTVTCYKCLQTIKRFQ